MIVNIEKATGRVVDVNQNYDGRIFDDVQYPDGTIPEGADPGHYFRAGDGTIARLTQSEIEAARPGEVARRLRGEFQTLLMDIVADVQALPAGPQKQILIKLLQFIRLIAKHTRME